MKSVWWKPREGEAPRKAFGVPAVMGWKAAIPALAFKWTREKFAPFSLFDLLVGVISTVLALALCISYAFPFMLVLSLAKLKERKSKRDKNKRDSFRIKKKGGE